MHKADAISIVIDNCDSDVLHWCQSHIVAGVNGDRCGHDASKIIIVERGDGDLACLAVFSQDNLLGVDFKHWPAIVICCRQPDGNGFGWPPDGLEQCAHDGLAFSEHQLGMKDFNCPDRFFKLDGASDDLAVLSQVQHVSSGAGVLEANRGWAALAVAMRSPACHHAIGFDTAAVGAAGTDSQEPSVDTNTSGAGRIAAVIGCAPARHHAIGFDATAVGAAGTDSQEPSAGTNTSGAGRIDAVIGCAPACHPAIGFDAAVVLRSSAERKKLGGVIDRIRRTTHVFLSKVVSSPTYNGVIFSDATAVEIASADGKEFAIVMNASSACRIRAVTSCAPADCLAIHFNAAVMSIASTDSQKLGVAINTGSLGRIGAIIAGQTPAERGAIGCDAAVVEISSTHRQQLNVGINGVRRTAEVSLLEGIIAPTYKISIRSDAAAVAVPHADLRLSA